MKKTITVILFVILFFVAHSQVKMQRIEGGLLFTENNQRIFLYQLDTKNLQGKYERCNYVHPLWGLDGSVLTEDFPEDHLHHRGIFWAWHQIRINGQQISDGWELKNFSQKVAEVEYTRSKSGASVLKTEVYWKSDLWKKDGDEVPYLRENTTITIYPLIDNYRKIEFEIQLLALEENLEIGGSEDDKGYSGFSVRMVLPDGINFSGVNGKLQSQIVPVQSAGYVNIYGKILTDEKNGGIVVVDHPENNGYPQPWILRSKSSMQNAVFPGNRMFPVSTKDRLVLRYSLLVYSGRLGNRKIKKIVR
ncbi:MAG: PmoA family protein [Prolixibacteraceae bacterium]|nr:PmoA family protein [Prolixibacteraceae bacterium]